MIMTLNVQMLRASLSGYVWYKEITAKKPGTFKFNCLTTINGYLFITRECFLTLTPTAYTTHHPTIFCFLTIIINF